MGRNKLAILALVVCIVGCGVHRVTTPTPIPNTPPNVPESSLKSDDLKSMCKSGLNIFNEQLAMKAVDPGKINQVFVDFDGSNLPIRLVYTSKAKDFSFFGFEIIEQNCETLSIIAVNRDDPERKINFVITAANNDSLSFEAHDNSVDHNVKIAKDSESNLRVDAARTSLAGLDGVSAIYFTDGKTPALPFATKWLRVISQSTIINQVVSVKMKQAQLKGLENVSLSWTEIVGLSSQYLKSQGISDNDNVDSGEPRKAVQSVSIVGAVKRKFFSKANCSFKGKNFNLVITPRSQNSADGIDYLVVDIPNLVLKGKSQVRMSLGAESVNYYFAHYLTNESIDYMGFSQIKAQKSRCEMKIRVVTIDEIFGSLSCKRLTAADDFTKTINLEATFSCLPKSPTEEAATEVELLTNTFQK